MLMPSGFGGRDEPEVSLGCFLQECTSSDFLDDGVMARIRGTGASARCKPGIIQVQCWSSHCLGAESRPQELKQEP